jgi:serine/threonine protein kinase
VNGIEVSCPNCPARYAVPDPCLRTALRCPRCGRAFAAAAGDARVKDGVAALWRPGDLILGLYEVIQVHESGGMGLVYRVRHRGWKMDLAVKSPRREFFTTERHKENFIREAETWVKLGLHPHAVSCYYVRTLGGLPRVFAEYVDGGSLADWIRSRKLYEGGPAKALERILDVSIQFAWGLHFAHERGLVHHDVKPANVLLAPDGTAKVTDFGLARARHLTQESDATTLGAMTPAYCSPEQAARKSDLTRATDVWSWAASVLELFMGQVTWMSGSAAGEVLEAYADEPPEDAAIPRLPAKLVDVLRRCFRLDPAARWGSMSEAADALEAIYRETQGRPYPRSKPRSADVRAAGVNNRGVSMYDLGRMDEAAEHFDRALREDPHQLEATYNRDLLGWQRGGVPDDARVRHLQAVQESHPEEWAAPYLLGVVELGRGNPEAAGPAFEEAARRAPEEPDVRTRLGETKMALGRWAEAQADFEHALRLRPADADAAGGLALAHLRQEGRRIEAARAWNLIPPGKRTGRWRVGTLPAAQAQVVYPRIARLAGSRGPGADLVACALSPDARLAVFGGEDGSLALFDLADGRWPQKLEGHARGVGAAIFTIDGRRVITGGSDGQILIWEVATGACRQVLQGHTGAVLALWQDPNDARLVSASADGTARVWSPVSGKSVSTREMPRGRVVAIGPRGEAVAVGAEGQPVRVVPFGGNLKPPDLEGGMTGAAALAFGPEGDRLLAGGPQGEARVFELEGGRCVAVLAGHRGAVRAVAWSPDGRWALTGGDDRCVRLWDAWTGRCLRSFADLAGAARCAAFSRDGRRVVAGGGPEAVAWHAEIEALAEEPRPARMLESRHQHEAVEKAHAALDSARERMAAERHEEAAESVRQVRLMPGYERSPEALDLWEELGRKGRRTSLRSAWRRGNLVGGEGGVAAIDYMKDRVRLVAQGRDGAFRLWNGVRPEPLVQFEGAPATYRSVAFGAGGRRVLGGSAK